MVKPEDIQSIIMNPFYAITVAPQLVEEHLPSIRDKEWVKANASLIGEIGAEQWLTQLLDVLEGSIVARQEYMSPFNAINIDPMFAVAHPPILDKERWIQANVMLLPQLGIKQWLEQLLNVLEGDIVTAENIGLTTPSKVSQTRLHKYKHKKRKKRKR